MPNTKEYEPPLVLTSPHMKGQKVKDAQWLMAGHSRFPDLGTYKDGALDGDYGLLSEKATERAKFWLGFPLSACDGVFGQTLYEYLRPNKWRELPKENQKRRATRLKAAAATPGLKAFNYAVGEIGYREVPRNWTKFGRAYGFDGVPWCAIFESECFAFTGYHDFHYAAVERIYHDALNGNNHLRIVRTPQRGDLVLFSLHGDRYAHTSFFDEWVSETGRQFRDLGGNTGPSSINNGGMVARGERYMSQVLAIVRVG